MGLSFVQSFRVIQFVYSIPSHIHSFREQAGNCFADRIITTHWREMLSFGVALAVISAVTACFYNAFVLGASFLVLGALHAVHTIRLHHYAVLQGIERTAETLRRNTERLTSEAHTLREQVQTQIQLNENLTHLNTNLQANVAQAQEETENQRRANLQHQVNIDRMAQANVTLKQTNGSLEKQVIALTEQNSDLRESAQWIRHEIRRMGVQNSSFGEKITLFDQRLMASGLLYEEVLKNLDNYKAKLQNQADGVKKFLNELFAKNLLAEDTLIQKLAALDILYKKLEDTTTKLQTTELQCVAKSTQLEMVSTRLKEVEEGLSLLLPKFQEVQKGLGSSHQAHAEEVAKLQTIVTRLTSFTQQDLTTSPSCNLNPSPAQWTPLKGTRENVWLSTAQGISEAATK